MKEITKIQTFSNKTPFLYKKYSFFSQLSSVVFLNDLFSRHSQTNSYAVFSEVEDPLQHS